MKKNQVALLIVVLVMIVLGIILLPYANLDRRHSLFSYSYDELHSIEFQDKNHHYGIEIASNPHAVYGQLYQIKFLRNNKPTIFYGKPRVNRLLQNLLDIKYETQIHNAQEKRSEYGIEECKSYLILVTDVENKLCIGGTTFDQKNVYVSMKNEAYVIKTYALHALKRGLENWINKQAFVLDNTKVNKLIIQPDINFLTDYPYLAKNIKPFDNKFEVKRAMDKSKNSKQLWFVKHDERLTHRTISRFVYSLLELHVNFESNTKLTNVPVRLPDSPIIKVGIWIDEDEVDVFSIYAMERTTHQKSRSKASKVNHAFYVQGMYHSGFASVQGFRSAQRGLKQIERFIQYISKTPAK